MRGLFHSALAAAVLFAATGSVMSEEARPTAQDSIARTCEMAPKMCLEMHVGVHGKRLDIGVEAWCADDPIACALVQVECDVDNRGLVFTHTAWGMGSLYAGSLLSHTFITLRTRSPAFPIDIRIPRVQFSVTKLERGEGPGDWIATLEPELEVSKVLDVMSSGPAIEFHEPGGNPYLVLDADGEASPTVIQFADDCRVSLERGDED